MEGLETLSGFFFSVKGCIGPPPHAVVLLLFLMSKDQGGDVRVGREQPQHAASDTSSRHTWNHQI